MVYIIGQDSLDFSKDGRSTLSKIKQDKINFTMNGDKLGIRTSSVILGEVQRDPNKDYSDENISKILRGLRGMTMKSPEVDYILIELINTYIPPAVSDIEVMEWFGTSYDRESISDMGKRAYSVIGEAKKFFKDRDFNSGCIKTAIDEIINE